MAGGPGANGAGIEAVNDGSIETFGDNSTGMIVLSRGGTGGQGGDGGPWYYGRSGGRGGEGGDLLVGGTGSIFTHGVNAVGIPRSARAASAATAAAAKPPPAAATAAAAAAPATCGSTAPSTSIPSA